MMTGRATRQSRQRLLNNLTSRSVGRGQGRRQPARLAREPLTAAGAEAIRTLRVNLDTSTLTTCQAKSKLLQVMSFLPRCFYCRRLIVNPFRFVIWRRSRRYRIAHQDCRHSHLLETSHAPAAPTLVERFRESGFWCQMGATAREPETRAELFGL